MTEARLPTMHRRAGTQMIPCGVVPRAPLTGRLLEVASGTNGACKAHSMVLGRVVPDERSRTPNAGYGRGWGWQEGCVACHSVRESS
jgi:hypothetical protein